MESTDINIKAEKKWGWSWWMPNQGFSIATTVFKNLSNDEQRMSLCQLKCSERTGLFSSSHSFKAKQIFCPTSRSLTGSKLCN